MLSNSSFTGVETLSMVGINATNASAVTVATQVWRGAGLGGLWKPNNSRLAKQLCLALGLHCWSCCHSLQRPHMSGSRASPHAGQHHHPDAARLLGHALCVPEPQGHGRGRLALPLLRTNCGAGGLLGEAGCSRLGWGGVELLLVCLQLLHFHAPHHYVATPLLLHTDHVRLPIRLRPQRPLHGHP